MRGMDDADSPESLLVGGPIHERSEGSIAASPVTCVSRSAPRFHIQHGAVTASCWSGRARRSNRPCSRPAPLRRWSPLKALSHWGVDNDGIVERSEGIRPMQNKVRQLARPWPFSIVRW
jgi:hypothetical protein